MKSIKDRMAISTGAYLHIAHGLITGKRVTMVAPVKPDAMDDYKCFLELSYKASQFFQDMSGNLVAKSI